MMNLNILVPAFAFFNPILLWGTLAASIPIIIYLLNRRRFKRVEWAAMEFLLRAIRKNRRRLQLQNILLLVIRTLIVLIMLMALAKPVGETLIQALGSEQKNMVILIDNSYSMGYKYGTKSNLQRAKDFAKKQADYLTPGDKFKLITFSDTVKLDPPSGVYTVADEKDKAKIISTIDTIEPSSRTTDLAAALRSLLDVLSDMSGGPDAEKNAEIPKQVFLFTDCTTAAFLKSSGTPTSEEERRLMPKVLKNSEIAGIARELKEQKVNIQLIDVGEEKWENLAVTELTVENPIIGTEMNQKFVAEVTNYRPEPADEITVVFVVDGEERDSKTVNLKPYDSQRVVFNHTFLNEGSHWASVELKTDRLAEDNSRFVSFRVMDANRVLLVSGQEGLGEWAGETDFISVALNPVEGVGGGRRLSLFDAITVNESALTDEKLDEFDSICVANVPSISEEEVARLEKYVKPGRGLVIFLGDLVSADDYNEFLWKDGTGLLPAKIGRVKGDPERKTTYYMKVADRRHPLFYKAGDLLLRQMESSMFYRYVEVDQATVESAGEDVEVLARLTDQDGTPLIIEKRYGRGRVLLVTTSADYDWNKWCGSPSYLPLMHEMFAYLSHASSSRRNLVVGECFKSRFNIWAKEVRVFKPNGQSEKKTLSKSSASDRDCIMTHEDTEDSGVYRIAFMEEREESETPESEGGAEKKREKKTAHFSVNVDNSESDLTRCTREELKKHVPELPFNMIKFKELSSLKVEDAGADLNFWWKMFVVIVLGLLVLETILAQVFGRYESAS